MKKIVVVLTLLFTSSYLFSQAVDSTGIISKVKKVNKELKFTFNEDGSHYVKFSFLNQIWIRYNESNPGTMVFKTAKAQTYDIGLRRTRIQAFGKISDRVFFYTQFGQNNLGTNSARKQGLFFLDALAEYQVAREYLSLGGGLNGWNGPSRYSSPSVGSVLSLDVPLYQQSTNDVNDQFLRKLSIYAKGKIGKFDYRLAVVDPMAVQNSTVQSSSITTNSLFASEPGNAQIDGYLKFQFFDTEANTTPYNAGSYLGTKKVLALGAGFVSQQDAMWHLSDDLKDTLRESLGLFALDLFYDAPLNAEKGNAITAYACFSATDFGKNYLRNVGVLNPGNAVNANASFNGAGNAVPLIGTGNNLFFQLGYLCKRNLLGKQGTLQPYANIQYSQFQLLKDPMVLFDVGINWLIEGHTSKLSLNYQNRPIFTMDAGGYYIANSRRGMLVLQYQIAI